LYFGCLDLYFGCLDLYIGFLSWPHELGPGQHLAQMGPGPGPNLGPT
jgi:hypothetical protein